MSNKIEEDDIYSLGGAVKELTIRMQTLELVFVYICSKHPSLFDIDELMEVTKKAREEIIKDYEEAYEKWQKTTKSDNNQKH